METLAYYFELAKRQKTRMRFWLKNVNDDGIAIKWYVREVITDCCGEVKYLSLSEKFDSTYIETYSFDVIDTWAVSNSDKE
jgi:hypothetical protein